MKKISSRTLWILTHEHTCTCRHYSCFSCLNPFPCPPSSLSSPTTSFFSDNPVLYSCPIFQSAFFSSHSSGSSSQHLSQICHYVTVFSLLCDNNREDRARRAKGISLPTSPSYIKSFLSFRRTALQHESNPADVLFRVESQAPPQREKQKCRLREHQSLGQVCVGVVTPALHPGPRSTLSFLRGFFPLSVLGIHSAVLVSGFLFCFLLVIQRVALWHIYCILVQACSKDSLC